MAKRPSPGHTKTRLCPPLSPETAAQLYECFLLDTVRTVRSIPGITPIVAYSPADAVGYFHLMAPDFHLEPQVGESLSQRLDHVMTRSLSQGFDQVVAINSDGPTLPPAHITAAFTRLDDVSIDITLGPCDDGGYYLIGWKRPDPHLIRDVSMSTPTVLRDTLAVAASQGLSVSLLPPWYDIDSPQDLARLKQELAADPQVGLHTRQLLDTIPFELLATTAFKE